MNRFLSYNGDYSDVFTDTTLVIIFTTVTLNGVVAGPLVRSLSLTDRGQDRQSSDWERYTWWEERYLRPVLLQDRQTRGTDFQTNTAGLGSHNLAFDMQEKQGQEDSAVDLNKHFNSIVNF